MPKLKPITTVSTHGCVKYMPYGSWKGDFCFSCESLMLASVFYFGMITFFEIALKTQ